MFFVVVNSKPDICFVPVLFFRYTKSCCTRSCCKDFTCIKLIIFWRTNPLLWSLPANSDWCPLLLARRTVWYCKGDIRREDTTRWVDCLTAPLHSPDGKQFATIKTVHPTVSGFRDKNINSLQCRDPKMHATYSYQIKVTAIYMQTSQPHKW